MVLEIAEFVIRSGEEDGFAVAYARAARPAAGHLWLSVDTHDQIVALLQRSSPAAVAGDITAPTLLIQGERDTLFGLDQADATARQLASTGAPLKVVWYAGGHDGGAPATALQEQIGAWFDYHLRRIGADPGTGFDYQVQGIFGTRRGIAGRTVTTPAYPGLDGVPLPRRELALRGEPQQVIRPPSGSPAALSSLPGLTGALTEGAGALDGVAMDLPSQAATSVTDPLTDPAEHHGLRYTTSKPIPTIGPARRSRSRRFHRSDRR